MVAPGCLIVAAIITGVDLLASKHTHTAQQTAAKAPKTPSAAGPWTPQVDRQPDFNPFANIEAPERSPGATLPTAAASPTIRDPAVDTAPLQGMHDLSDADSLIDVIAAGSGGGGAK
jgi:hypothetical protein